MGLFDTIKENTNLVRGESSQSAGKFDQQIEAVEGQIREALIQIGTVYLEKHREDCEPEYGEFINQIKALEEQKETLERNKLAINAALSWSLWKYPAQADGSALPAALRWQRGMLSARPAAPR